MLVSTDIFDGLRWVAIACFVVSIVAALVFIPKDLDRTSERAKKLRVRMHFVVMGLIAVGVIAFGIEPFGSPIVIVKIGAGGEVATTRGTLFREQPYVFQDQHVATIMGAPDGTTVVNDSTKTMRVELTSYGDPTMTLAARMFDPPAAVPPMSIKALERRVDFVGPDDRPPASVQGIHSEKRYWLTW